MMERNFNESVVNAFFDTERLTASLSLSTVSLGLREIEPDPISPLASNFICSELTEIFTRGRGHYVCVKHT